MKGLLKKEFPARPTFHGMALTGDVLARFGLPHAEREGYTGRFPSISNICVTYLSRYFFLDTSVFHRSNEGKVKFFLPISFGVFVTTLLF
jgi:hypothetical protein